MNGASSKWFLGLSALVACAIAFYFLRPEATCVSYPDGRPRQLLLGLVAWPDALLAHGSQGCDPWDGIVPEQPIDTMQVAYTYETGAEPTHIAFLLQSDGNGYRMLATGIEKLSAPTTLAEARALRGTAASHLVFFRDAAIYGKVRQALAPLRDYSESVGGGGQPGRHTVTCRQPAEKSGLLYSVAWSAPGAGGEPARSVFTSGECAASAAARERILRAYTMVSRLQ